MELIYLKIRIISNLWQKKNNISCLSHILREGFQVGAISNILNGE